MVFKRRIRRLAVFFCSYTTLFGLPGVYALFGPSQQVYFPMLRR
jgi:hypothetical protein